jgi:YHS domain-containing protein
MKNIRQFTCLAAVGLALASIPSTASAETSACGGCCGTATPMADKAKSDAPAYPLDICVVSGEKLGEMGDAYVFNYKGQEVKLCCKKCKAKFDKDPETYLKKITEAQAKAKK